MKYTDALPDLIEGAYKELFEAADKVALDYKAAESNRTPLEMIVECATVPGFLAPTIRALAMPPMDGPMPTFDHLKTVDDCRQHFDSVKADLYDAIRAFPQERIMEKIATPWGTFTWVEFMSYAYWNPMYHYGQIAYIQMIHGDTSM